MDVAEIVFTVTEWIGVIAFAVSGAIVAVRVEWIFSAFRSWDASQPSEAGSYAIF